MRSILRFVDPCGLWQELHSIFPSRSGMCPKRCCLATWGLWHATHVSVMDACLSCAWSVCGLWTEWQVTQLRLRASCMLPLHCAWAPRLWHVVQTADASRGAISVKTRIFVLSPVSECSLPGPWHVSHAWFLFPDGVRTFCARP